MRKADESLYCPALSKKWHLQIVGLSFGFTWARLCPILMMTTGKCAMRTQSADTDVKMEAAWIALLRKAKPCQKFAQVRSLSQMTLSLSRRAISRKYAHVPDAELRALFVHYEYGEELADRFRQYQKKRSHGES